MLIKKRISKQRKVYVYSRFTTYRVEWNKYLFEHLTYIGLPDRVCRTMHCRYAVCAPGILCYKHGLFEPLWTRQSRGKQTINACSV